MKLIIYNENTFEVVNRIETQYLIRKPFNLDSKCFWVDIEDTKEYPRTYEYIVNKWIPNVESNDGEVERYLLEVTSALLTPQYLLVPKDSGMYLAIWLQKYEGEQSHGEERKLEIRMSWVFYIPDHHNLSEEQKKDGLNIFLFEQLSWTRLKDYISNDTFQYLRFIPLNIGVPYLYLLHLIESEHFTRKEIEYIWRKN